MKKIEIENCLNKNNFFLKKKGEEYTLYEGKHNIITEFDCDDDNEISKNLIKELKNHIEKIDSNDKDYYDNCDAKYLKTTWKKLLNKIIRLIQKEENLIKEKEKQFKVLKSDDYGLSF